MGFKNFKFLFVRDDFFAITGRTVGHNAIFILLQMVVPVTLAILMSLFFFAFLSTENGLITRLLGKMDITYGFYSKDANSVWLFLLVFLNQWKSVGYNMVVYLAAITGLDRTGV